MWRSVSVSVLSKWCVTFLICKSSNWDVGTQLSVSSGARMLACLYGMSLTGHACSLGLNMVMNMSNPHVPVWDLSVDKCACVRVRVCPCINHNDRTTHVLYRAIVSWGISVTSTTHTHTQTYTYTILILGPSAPAKIFLLTTSICFTVSPNAHRT